MRIGQTNSEVRMAITNKGGAEVTLCGEGFQGRETARKEGSGFICLSSHIRISSQGITFHPLPPSPPLHPPPSYHPSTGQTNLKNV